MSRENMKNAAINFLQKKSYKYLKTLGEGGFASVIAVLSPKNEVLAVKIVQKEGFWIIEDQVWPVLRHRNILPVLEIMEIENPSAKLYVTPVLPKALDEAVQSEKFRSDPNALTKIKLWMYDVLMALDYLHSFGFCHCDIKSDNILIDEEERAVVCDFSGLNYSAKPLSAICSPLIFRPPECFRTVANQNIQGVPYDVYTFGLTVLNLLTGHWLQIELTRVTHGNWTWSMHVWPILRKTLQTSNIEYFMKKVFPLAGISKRDVEQAIDFVRSILKIQPKDRPTVRDIMKHPFLKMDRNPFKAPKENDCALSVEANINNNNLIPKKDCFKVSGNQCNTAQRVTSIVQEVCKIKVILPKLVARCQRATIGKIQPAMQHFMIVDSEDDPRLYLLQNESHRIANKKKVTIKKRIKERIIGWIREKFEKSKTTYILL